jgi:class 3 adenylate cyclase
MSRHSQGTSGLALRIGLNSGPTTAGVLRGEKSRFQLFGDVRCIAIINSLRMSSSLLTFINSFSVLHMQTVNTAARMESNGEPHKIHVSETTAELIKIAGKGYVFNTELFIDNDTF